MTYLLKVDANLKDLINKEVEEWKEGDSRTFSFGFREVGLSKEPTEDELEIIGAGIEYIEALEIGEDEMLLVTVDEYTLKAAYATRLQDWIEESDLRQFGRYESCGWV